MGAGRRFGGRETGFREAGDAGPCGSASPILRSVNPAGQGGIGHGKQQNGHEQKPEKPVENLPLHGQPPRGQAGLRS